MNTSEKVKNELQLLVNEIQSLLKLSSKIDDILKFGKAYQDWYSRALKIVELLGYDRLDEFRNYYLIDPKRKSFSVSSYSIQDYIKGLGAAEDYSGTPRWDIHNTVSILVYNQFHILESLQSRIDSILEDVKGHLHTEIQDDELKESIKLLKVNYRAAGALAGVILERHLQRVATNHNIKLSKKNPTITDLNDPLKNATIYDTPTWRKIQYLADVRNICSHQKDTEPTKEQVQELVEGVNSIIKNIF